ncbi:MAG: hypothetical protein RIG62_05250 [Cyclobacteriaceae bacterium]
MRSQKYLPACLVQVVFILVAHHPVKGQEYYTSSTGRANIHFIVSGKLTSASTDKVEIIYDKKKETVWISFAVRSFVTENKKLTKKLFKKNKAKFVIRGNVSETNTQHAGIDYLQFAFIGRIFNNSFGGHVGAAGRFDFSPANRAKGYEFTLSTGVEPKWFGEQFDEMVGYTIVNIDIITTPLNPIIKQEETSLPLDLNYCSKIG